jgi:hypothetical protein
MNEIPVHRHLQRLSSWAAFYPSVLRRGNDISIARFSWVSYTGAALPPGSEVSLPFSESGWMFSGIGWSSPCCAFFKLPIGLEFLLHCRFHADGVHYGSSASIGRYSIYRFGVMELKTRRALPPGG